MEPLRLVQSRTLVLTESNIDTDQILPARFLTGVGKSGLGQHAFADWRYGPSGELRPECILNQLDASKHRVLVAGPNFGCGSSREHAPWAMLDYGFQAIISTRIADIFAANALKNGLLALTVNARSQSWLVAHPGVKLEIDLLNCELRLVDGPISRFSIEPFSRHCLLNGIDHLGYLLQRTDKITAFEKRLSEANQSANTDKFRSPMA